MVLTSRESVEAALYFSSADAVVGRTERLEDGWYTDSEEPAAACAGRKPMTAPKKGLAG